MPAAQAGKREVLPTVVSVGAQKIFLTKDRVANDASRTALATGSNLSYHYGPVMTKAAVVTPIYWGTSWTDTATVGSDNKDKVDGLTKLYQGYNNSNHAGISTQYYQTSPTTYVSKGVTLNSAIIDTSAASSDSTTIFNKIVEKVGAGTLTVTYDSYIPVYTDLPRGTAGYCAWHSYGTANLSDGSSVVVKFAFFFNLNGDSGCDPADTRTIYKQGTEALANVSIHELAEAMTDPQLNAWYDSKGYENADKCAWNFAGGLVTLGTTAWKLQGEWSNSAKACKW